MFPIELVTSSSFLIPWSVSFPGASIAGDPTVEVTRLDDDTPVAVQDAWISDVAVGDGLAVVFVLAAAPSPGRHRYTVSVPDRAPLTIDTELIACEPR